jgi:hypothetical protein
LTRPPPSSCSTIEPACGKTCLIGVEAIPNGEWNGKPQFKYKLTFPKGGQKPIVPESHTEAPPF